MTSLTLAQYAQLEKQPLAKGLMLGIAQEGVVTDLLSFRNLGGALSETGVRYDEVISPDWVALDGSIASKSANGKPLSFGVYQMAVHIDVPALLDENNKTQLERLSVQQTKLAMKGAAYEANNVFINGDQASDPNQFEGLNKMVAELDTSQTVGSSEIDISGNYSATTLAALLDRIDALFHACEGHIPTAVFANSAFLLKFQSWLRQGGIAGNNYNWMEAAFKVDDPRRSLRTAATRPAFVYREVPFYDLGKKADQSTQVIGSAYAEGGSAGATRLFAVKVSEEDLEGIQASPLSVKDIGLLQDKEVVRKRLTWTVGIANWGPRSIVKAQGIKVA